MAFYPIQEVYFGKSHVQEAFEAFSKFRSKYVTNSAFKFNIQIAKDPDLIAFNRAMEKTFGFNSYSLYIFNESQFSAFTIPVSFTNPILATKLIKTGKALVKTGSGIKYNKDLGVNAMTVVSTGALFRAELTDEEFFSIILHEIGHNFQEALSYTVMGLSFASMFFELISALLQGWLLEIPLIVAGRIGLTGVLNKIDDTIKKTPGLNVIVNALGSAVTLSLQLLRDIRMIIDIVVPIPLSRLGEAMTQTFLNRLRKFNPVTLLTGVAGENIADSFATMYGYGPAITSALYKARQAKGLYGLPYEAIDRIPILKEIIYIKDVPFILISGAFDEHPSEYQRADTAVDSLKHDLESADPKFRKAIMKDIDAIQQNTKDMEDKIKKLSPEQRNVFENLIDYTVYKTVGKVDPKNLLAKAIVKHDNEADRIIANAPLESDLPINKVKLK